MITLFHLPLSRLRWLRALFSADHHRDHGTRVRIIVRSRHFNTRHS
jgi:hypothetical protein